jgi:hypothetical protein
MRDIVLGRKAGGVNMIHARRAEKRMVEAFEHRILEFPLVGKTRLEASAKARSRLISSRRERHERRQSLFLTASRIAIVMES